MESITRRCSSKSYSEKFCQNKKTPMQESRLRLFMNNVASLQLAKKRLLYWIHFQRIPKGYYQGILIGLREGQITKGINAFLEDHCDKFTKTTFTKTEIVAFSKSLIKKMHHHHSYRHCAYHNHHCSNVHLHRQT